MHVKNLDKTIIEAVISFTDNETEKKYEQRLNLFK